MALLISDAFTASNGTAMNGRTPDTTVSSRTWSTVDFFSGFINTIDIQNNALSIVDSDNGIIIDAGQADIVAQWKCTPASLATAFRGGIRVRCNSSNPNNYYFLTIRYDLGSGNIRFTRVDNYLETTLGSDVTYSFTAGNTYTIRVEVIGSSLKLYINGVLQKSATDSTYTTQTYVGFGAGVVSGQNYTVDECYISQIVTRSLVAAEAATSSLTSAGRNNFNLLSSLAGSSSLAVTILGTNYSLVADLIGSSQLTTLGSNQFSVAASETGTSQLTSQAANIFALIAAEIATSQLTSAGKNSFSVQAAENGSSQLTSLLQNLFQLSATEIASSQLTSSGLNTFSIEANEIGTSQMLASTATLIAIAAALAGSSILTAQAGSSFNIAAAEIATSSLTGSGKNDFSIQSNLQGVSLLSSFGSNGFLLIVSQQGNSQLIAWGGTPFALLASLSGTSLLTADGRNTLGLAADLAGTSSLLARARSDWSIAANEIATSQLTAYLVLQIATRILRLQTSNSGKHASRSADVSVNRSGSINQANNTVEISDDH